MTSPSPRARTLPLQPSDALRGHPVGRPTAPRPEVDRAEDLERRIEELAERVTRHYRPPAGAPRPAYLRRLARRNAALYLTARAYDLDTTELAARLGWHRATVWRALQAGQALVDAGRHTEGFSHPDRPREDRLRTPRNEARW